MPLTGIVSHASYLSAQDDIGSRAMRVPLRIQMHPHCIHTGYCRVLLTCLRRTTGNEGASREYWYHRAVLVAWPKSLRLSVAEAGGFNALVELLVQTLQDHTWWQSGAQDGSRAAALPQPQQQSGQPQQSARAKRSRSSGASADGNDGSLGEAKGSKKRKTEQRATAIAAEQPTQLAAGNAGVQPAQPAAISTGARPGQQPEVPGQADRGRGQLRLGAVTAVLTAMLKALKDDKCLMVQEVDRWGYQESGYLCICIVCTPCLIQCVPGTALSVCMYVCISLYQSVCI